MSEYLAHRLALKNGTKIAKPEPPKPLQKKSAKKIAEEKAIKEALGDNDTELETWFKAVRKKLTGYCQCGCGRSSSKDDNKYFRASCCHILPKALFPSVATHPMNFIERNFWDGCHTNLDQQGLDRWPGMFDWEDIRRKFSILSPQLTKEEKRIKFFKQLKTLAEKHS